MSKSVIDQIMPYLVIGGFMGIVYLCACGWLILACLRFYRLEAIRSWQVAAFASLAYTGLSLVSIAASGVIVYQQLTSMINFDILQQIFEVVVEGVKITQLLMFISITVALSKPLLRLKENLQTPHETDAG